MPVPSGLLSRDEDELRLRDNRQRVIDAFLRDRRKWCPDVAGYPGHADSLLCGEGNSIRHGDTLLYPGNTLFHHENTCFRRFLTTPSAPAAQPPLLRKGNNILD